MHDTEHRFSITDNLELEKGKDQKSKISANFLYHIILSGKAMPGHNRVGICIAKWL